MARIVSTQQRQIPSQAKCKVDGQFFDPRDTAEYLGSVTFTTNMSLVREVLQPMRQEFGTERIWERICPSCAQDRVTAWQDRAASSKTELTDDELYYGVDQ